MELHAQIACSMPIELLKKGVVWQERAVYTEAVLYCRANLTDGIIHRNLLALWMPDMPAQQRARRLNDMTTKGALLEHPEGWAFPEHVWNRWNPTRAQVDAKRAEEAARKADWRERKRRESDASHNGVPMGHTPDATRLSRPVPDSQSQSQSQSQEETFHPTHEVTRNAPTPVDISAWAERRRLA